MTSTSAKSIANKLTTQRRIDLAKRRMSRVIDHVLHSIALHESNEFVLYSDVLSSQISNSHAGHTFNLMRDSLFRYGVIRLCALWDIDKDLEYESISTVVELIDDHEVILALMRETCGQWAGRASHVLNLPDEPELAKEVLRLSQESDDRFGRQQAVMAAKSLLRTIALARRVCASDDMKVIRQLRNKHLAHSLNETREEKLIGPIRQMKYREETELLKKAISIAGDLHCWVNGASFDFDFSRKMRREQSEALWKGTTFKSLR